MSEKYTHLKEEERAIIEIRLNEGASCREVARQLGRHVATITREVARNGGKAHYRAKDAGQRYQQTRQVCVKPRKLKEGTPLNQKVYAMLEHRQWSPQQIAARLKLNYPDDPDLQVSHETIYTTIYAYPRDELKKLLINHLCQAWQTA